MATAENLGAGTICMRPLARVVYIGTQHGLRGESFALYNIVSGVGLPVGSTVTWAGLERRGYNVVEVIP